jgi:3-oxoacyl-[acyl-carrier-protein] synthase II
MRKPLNSLRTESGRWSHLFENRHFHAGFKYINTHGTSTVLNDLVETRAIKKVFGEHAYRISLDSTKSMIGHTIGAAGAIEGIVCALTLRRNVIHPTINYEEPDPECDLDYTPNQARERDVKVALSNSFAFGGNNSCLVMKALS